MSAMERMSLHMPNANVVLAARFRRRLQTQDVERALPALCQRHPMAAVRVEQHESNQAAFTTWGVALPPVEESGELDMLAAISEEHRTPFSWPEGPLMRFRLIPDGKDRTICLITAHHATCDGLSLFYVLRDLADWIETGGFSSSRPSPIAIRTAAPPLRTSWGERTMMKLLSRKWRRKGITFSAKDTARLHEAFWSGHRSHALAGRLTREETLGFVEACRTQSVTVGNALTSACISAQAKTQPGSPIAGTTLVSVSLRDRLNPPVGDALGFYATGVRVPYRHVTGHSPWTSARSFGQELDRLLTTENLLALRRLELLDPGLIDALAFARGGLCTDPLAQKLLTRSGKDRVIAGLLMANLGRLTSSAQDVPAHLDAIYGPFVCSDTTEKYMAAATVAGRLHVSLSYDEAVLDVQTADAFFELVMKMLRRFGIR